MEHYIVVAGNLSDGFSFIGLFDSFDEADEYARFEFQNEYWIASLDAPAPAPAEKE